MSCNKKCWFCYSNKHDSKRCPIEADISLTLKNKAGAEFESYIADYIKCPNCFEYGFKRLNNNLPSLDIICDCGFNFEVKSKCLSVNELPNDIELNHGVYTECMERVEIYDLNLIVIIYGVDRTHKTISIREILYATNDMLRNPDIIEIHPKPNCKLSKIFIKDKTKLNKLYFTKTVISFKKEIDEYIASKKLLSQKIDL